MTISIIILPLVIYQEDPENLPAVQRVNQTARNLGICHLAGILVTMDCTLRVMGAEGVNYISWRGTHYRVKEEYKGVLHWRFRVLKFYSPTQQVACDFREADGELQHHRHIPVKDTGYNSKHILITIIQGPFSAWVSAKHHFTIFSSPSFCVRQLCIDEKYPFSVAFLSDASVQLFILWDELPLILCDNTSVTRMLTFSEEATSEIGTLVNDI
ncbi:hypothetical protein llap_14020 [Limosa lapponica baueri]|uniref:Uncharacterized protein n=1 Tax=Limosa lapponica baueri TaxID=1758121 RepID=A0A2I0TPD7_LIMLA|nr:hypothetical protein llap_14020 [Limosa lapponica baueri]